MGALAPVALCVALLATSARAACTCPDTPFTCTVDSLFSISGEENCVPSGGVLDASIVMPAATELTAVDFAGLTRVTGDILVRLYHLRSTSSPLQRLPKAPS